MQQSRDWINHTRHSSLTLLQILVETRTPQVLQGAGGHWKAKTRKTIWLEHKRLLLVVHAGQTCTSLRSYGLGTKRNLHTHGNQLYATPCCGATINDNCCMNLHGTQGEGKRMRLTSLQSRSTVTQATKTSTQFKAAKPGTCRALLVLLVSFAK